MKKTFTILVLLCLAFLSVPCQAAELQVGSRTIGYAAPAGYVLADESVYAAPLDILRRSIPKEAALHVMYVPAEADLAFRENPSIPLDCFVIIMSNSRGAQSDLIVSDFKTLSEEVKSKFGALSPDWTPDFLTVLPDSAGQPDGAEQPANVPAIVSNQTGGCFAITDTAISMLALLTQKMPDGPEPPLRHMAVVSTSLLSESKVLTVNQQRFVAGIDELNDFKAYSQEVVKQIGFKQGAAEGVTVSGLKKDFPLMNKIVLGVLIGLVVAYILRKMKPKSIFDK